MSIEQNSSTPPIDQSASQIGSCRSNLGLHDNSESLRQTAIAYMTQAEAALHQWRRSLEAEGVRYGAIHTYPHEGATRYNFYPSQPDQHGKKRRSYVSLESLPYYRAEIRRGQKCQQIQALEAQIGGLMQAAKRIA